MEPEQERQSGPQASDEAAPTPSSSAAERGGDAAAARGGAAPGPVQDLLLQSVVSILNLAGAPDRQGGRARPRAGAGRDRGGARRSSTLLDAEAQREQVREALSQVQMLYAREAAGRRGRRRAAAAPGAGRRAAAGPAPAPRRGGRGSRRRGFGPRARLDPKPRLTAATSMRRRLSRPPTSCRPLLAESRPDRRNPNLTDFLTDYGVVIALVCAGAAVLYGALVTQRLLAPLARQRADAGDLRGRPGGRQGLPEPPVHDHRRGRRVLLAILLAILQDVATGDRLRDRRRRSRARPASSA